MGLVRKARWLVRSGLTSLASTELGSQALLLVLEDREVLGMVVTRLSDRTARMSQVDRSLPRDLYEIENFEDCLWLFSPNPLDHGASRLMVDEAAHLFRTTKKFEAPQVAELGRYRGGTALMLAAAGGTVLSIDNDPSVAESDQRLRRALRRLELESRVDLRIGDSASFPIGERTFDIIFVDGDHTYEGAHRDVEHWQPSLRPGGCLLLHDAKIPPRPTLWADPGACESGPRRVADALRHRPGLLERAAPGTLVEFYVL